MLAETLHVIPTELCLLQLQFERESRFLVLGLLVIVLRFIMELNLTQGIGVHLRIAFNECHCRLQQMSGSRSERYDR